MLSKLSFNAILRSFYKGLCSFSILMAPKSILKLPPQEIILGQDWINVGSDFTNAIMKFEAKKHEKTFAK